MKWLYSLKWRPRAWVSLAVLTAALYTAPIALMAGADQTTRKQRDGGQLYQINCARCHTERYPTERTDAQWKTILLHMRTRAQIPAKDARAILNYLQENN